jgi:alpha-N-acetylglucosamine transferase
MEPAKTTTVYRKEYIMPNRVCEKMVRCDGVNLTCRVWVTANQNFEADTKKINEILSVFKLSQPTEDNMKIIISEIEKLDNIAAAEVLDKNGNGILLYPDWN